MGPVDQPPNQPPYGSTAPQPQQPPPFQPVIPPQAPPSPVVPGGTPTAIAPAPTLPTSPPPPATTPAQVSNSPDASGLLAGVQQAGANAQGQLQPINVTPVNAVTRTVDPNETVSSRLTSLLNSRSAYMQNARATGLRQASSRGLLNSSLAAGSAQQAAIAAGEPIASADAAAYQQAASQNQAFQNQAAQMTAGFQNAASTEQSRQHAQILGQTLAAVTDAYGKGFEEQSKAAADFRAAYYNADSQQRGAILSNWAATQSFTRAWTLDQQANFNKQLGDIQQRQYASEQAAVDRDIASRNRNEDINITAQQRVEDRNSAFLLQLMQQITAIGTSGATADQQHAAIQQLMSVQLPLLSFINGLSTNSDVSNYLATAVGLNPPGPGGSTTGAAPPPPPPPPPAPGTAGAIGNTVGNVVGNPNLGNQLHTATP